MVEFLVLLGKINLAMGLAVIAVYLLRRPIRAAFHAQIAYGLWLLVPVAALAIMLPARVVTIGSAAVIGSIKEVKLPVASGTMQPVLSVPQHLSPDWTLLLFAIWLVGSCGLALYLMRLQHKFHVAERVGAAGPAVVGFLRPRIVIPAVFETQFSNPEQRAILAHERAHLARQDARVNALVALLRCLCWFNPLIHLASAWLRRDQELACDAAALRQVSRLDYANALLKSQISAMSLPLGCAWPGSEHPLTERVALLKSQPPKASRRRTGIFLIALVTTFGGLAAWAAQPPTVSALPPLTKQSDAAGTASPANPQPKSSAIAPTTPLQLTQARNSSPATEQTTSSASSQTYSPAMAPTTPLQVAQGYNSSPATEQTTSSASSQTNSPAMAPTTPSQLIRGDNSSPVIEQIAIRASLINLYNATSNSAGGSIVTPINLEPILSTHTPPPYPAISQRLNKQGTVVLMVSIGADGNATDATITNSSGYGELDAAAIAWVISHWRWQPPTQDGKPVASKSFVAANFELVPSTP